jgi:hypothetical protein
MNLWSPNEPPSRPYEPMNLADTIKKERVEIMGKKGRKGLIRLRIKDGRKDNGKGLIGIGITLIQYSYE